MDTDTDPEQPIAVATSTVSCDGGGGPLGHPKVYLSLDRSGEIDCPYCGQRYRLDPEAAAADAH